MDSHLREQHLAFINAGLWFLAAALQIAGYESIAIAGGLLGMAILSFGFGAYRWIQNRNPRARVRVEIRVPSPANRSSEDWLEWIHAEVEPSGIDTVREARAWATIVGKKHRLMWSMREGPKEERTLRQGEPDYLPLACRLVGGTHISAAIALTAIDDNGAYVTDDQFLAHHVSGTILPGLGSYSIEIKIEHELGQSTRILDLHVPPDQEGQMRLSAG